MTGFLLLACWLSASLPATYSRPSLLINPTAADSARPDFCIREASLRAAQSLRVFENGSCILMDPHSDAADSLAMIAASPPIYMYMRQPPASSMLLLRTRAGTKPNAYDFITTGAVNHTQVDATSLNGTSEPYMSPLMDHQPAPFTQVHLQLFNNTSDTPVVDLVFRVEGSDVLRKGDWFSKDRLKSASPWDINVIKITTFKTFSLIGKGRRKFAILIHTTCDSMGYMYLFTISPACNFDMKFVNKEYYTYAPNVPVRFADGGAKEAFEFRITGDVSPTSLVYIREE